jgi:hypothetical protein
LRAQIARVGLADQLTGAAMTIVPLSLDPASEARALLRFMLAHGDIVGTDHARRTVLQRSKQLVFRCNRILFLLKSLCNCAPPPSHLSRRVATGAADLDGPKPARMRLWPSL